MRFRSFACLFVLMAAAAAGSEWNFTPDFAAAHHAQVLGSPRFLREAHLAFARFDGRGDAFVVPDNPVAGWRGFQIEIFFRPDGQGPKEQRFFCIEGSNHTWLTLETRMENGQWALDTYLKGPSDRRTELDRTRLHPGGQWHRVALRYDGNIMSSRVDGHVEEHDAVAFPAMAAGRTSVGMRLNRVYWFQGDIAWVRFTAIP